jgi:pimeloyl-ACP methyl ester carboxylesterase
LKKREGNVFISIVEYVLMSKKKRIDNKLKYNIREVPVMFGTHNIKLKGKALIPDSDSASIPGMVLCHGFGSGQRAMESSARILAEQGVATFIFDFRGHGSSEGAVDGKLADDVVDAWEVFSRFREVDGKRMGLAGHSLGAMSAIQAAGKIKDLKALIALSCPPQVKGWMTEQIPDNFGRWGGSTNGVMEYPRQGAFPWLRGAAALLCRAWMYFFHYRVRVDIRKFFDAVSKVVMVEVLKDLGNCPKLFVFCDGDNVTPYDKSMRVYREACEPKKELVINGGYHTAPLTSTAIRMQWTTWAVETLNS